MINAAHVIIYAEDADATRAFFRDVLGLRHVDAGDNWLIFALPPAELGVHPTGPPPGGGDGRHELYLMCDDITATIAELTAKGVEFTSPVTDRGWGLVASLRVPGGGELGLYEPRHPVAYR
jgi:catechol 2,3-dioxygenase-like lactoylglutathione lyase family enzyme